jgi:hypothetical protein
LKFVVVELPSGAHFNTKSAIQTALLPLNGLRDRIAERIEVFESAVAR